MKAAGTATGIAAERPGSFRALGTSCRGGCSARTLPMRPSRQRGAQKAVRSMGDKSPKAKDKNKKQDKSQKDAKEAKARDKAAPKAPDAKKR